MTDQTTWSELELRAALTTYEDELRAAGKARNTINTYVQHPERFINWLVGRYQPRPAVAVPIGPSGDSMERRSKYAPLQAHLQGRSDAVVRLTFAEIESILGGRLPASARQYRPWWANEASGTHVHARAWLDAGCRTTNVDLVGESVDFVRSK